MFPASLPFDQFGVMYLGDTGPLDPALTGDPCIFRTGTVVWFRDAAGVKYPLVPGTDGAGVVSLTGPLTYVLKDTDQTLICDTTAGAITVTYPALGGPELARKVQTLDAKRTFATHNVTLDGNGKNIGAAATLVLSTNGGGVTTTWGGTTWEPSALSSIAFNPAIPGPIGGTTPAAVTGTTITATTQFTGSGAGLTNIPGSAISGALGAPGAIGDVTPATELSALDIYLGSFFGTPRASRLHLYSATDYSHLMLGAPGGGNQTIGFVASSPTVYALEETLVINLADNGTYDYTTGGRGGIFLISAVNATTSVFASGSFAQNATAFTGGVTYTNFSTTLTTAAKLNVGASGGKLRIENKLGVSADIVVKLFIHGGA